MALIIYGTARSRASRALWMAEELGIPYRHVKVAAIDGGTVQPDFLALNPNGRIPVIDDDGVVVWESAAVNLYLAKRYGGPLAPRDAAEDGHMTMWSVWSMTELEPEAHEVLLHTINLDPAQRDAKVVGTSLARLHRPLRVLQDALLRGNGFLVGGRFTAADLNVAAVVFYLRGADAALLPFPEVADWYSAACARHAFASVMRLRETG